MSVDRKYKLYLAVFTTIARLPFSILYMLSDVMYLVMNHIIHYRRKVIRENLQLAFPQATTQQRKVWEKEFYHHLCDNIVETIKLLHISDKEMAKHVTIKGTETVQSIAHRGNPIIAFLGHYGNWEWIPYATSPFSAQIPSAQIYKPLRDVAFDKLMLTIRSRFKTESIPQKQALRRILSMKQEGCFLVGFVADHRSNNQATNHWVDFFGQQTQFNVGGETIGNKCKAEYVYIDVEKQGRGKYEVTYRAILPKEGETAYPYTKAYYQLLEQTIRKTPPYWLWSHRRWLFSKPVNQTSTNNIQ